MTKKALTVKEAGRLGGLKAAEKRPKEQYSKMAHARWNKPEIKKGVLEAV